MSGALAPALGRLADPPAARRWEAIRLDLLDAVIRGGDGGGRPGEAWVAAWAAAAAALRDAVLAEATAALDAAARHARLPARRRAALAPDAEQADILLQRLLAAAIPLEALAAAPDDAPTSRARAAALEAAWLEAVAIATAERGRWRATATGVAAWRRPLAPIVAAGAGLLVAATVAGAWLGGLVPAPGWFAPVTDWFWGLPWP